MNEPKCLTRMKLCECWGDNLNVEELKQVNVYIEQLQQENQQLKEDFIPKLQATKNRLDKDNYELTMKLKQRDEVIDEAITILENLETKLIIINNSDYVYPQEEVVKKVFVYQRRLLEILQRYKGDNK